MLFVHNATLRRLARYSHLHSLVMIPCHERKAYKWTNGKVKPWAWEWPQGSSIKNIPESNHTCSQWVWIQRRGVNDRFEPAASVWLHNDSRMNHKLFGSTWRNWVKPQEPCRARLGVGSGKHFDSDREWRNMHKRVEMWIGGEAVNPVDLRQYRQGRLSHRNTRLHSLTRVSRCLQRILQKDLFVIRLNSFYCTCIAQQ